MLRWTLAPLKIHPPSSRLALDQRRKSHRHRLAYASQWRCPDGFRWTLHVFFFGRAPAYAVTDDGSRAQPCPRGRGQVFVGAWAPPSLLGCTPERGAILAALSGCQDGNGRGCPWGRPQPCSPGGLHLAASRVGALRAMPPLDACGIACIGSQLPVQPWTR